MKTKKGIYILGFLLLFLFSVSGISSAKVYQISEAELTQLEQSLEEQESLLIQVLSLQELQKSELQGLKMQLETALSELVASKSEIQKLKRNLEEASSSIEKANQLFKEYEKEAKRTQSRLTRQRNLWQLLFMGIGIGYIAK